MLGIRFAIVVYMMYLYQIFTCTDCRGNIVLEIFSGDFLNDCIKNKPWYVGVSWQKLIKDVPGYWGCGAEDLLYQLLTKAAQLGTIALRENLKSTCGILRGKCLWNQIFRGSP